MVYPQLAESTLVGVLHYPKGGSDYRGQTISAGFYTLRYELMPSDANHLGAAPNRDFLLLVPAASDADPNAVFKFPDLVALSEKATGTRHPGPLSLVQSETVAPPLRYPRMTRTTGLFPPAWSSLPAKSLPSRSWSRERHNSRNPELRHARP